MSSTLRTLKQVQDKKYQMIKNHGTVEGELQAMFSADSILPGAPSSPKRFRTWSSILCEVDQSSTNKFNSSSAVADWANGIVGINLVVVPHGLEQDVIEFYVVYTAHIKQLTLALNKKTDEAEEDKIRNSFTFAYLYACLHGSDKHSKVEGRCRTSRRTTST
ncbi:hypothetical protein LTS10_004565 [Elasticomyces elasticus]|nr:hypothetical protein LTS10_004565 [Elasticomyces elasticus]